MIDEAAHTLIARELAPIAAKTLRDLLRESGRPLAPLVEGVRQDSFANLERTLLGLAQVYGDADRDGRTRCRSAVIQAKDHARFAARSSPEKQADKNEMILWMLTWLENPGVFEIWLGMRKRAIEARSMPPE